ncbi:unnamed protein product [Larinioides sclopetarius]|uniref:Ribosomal protein L20 n=1 Tax=Larinioides sclopetarius TaxID=280406 RepID=A0AAV1YUY9_9ARAC
MFIMKYNRTVSSSIFRTLKNVIRVERSVLCSKIHQRQLNWSLHFLRKSAQSTLQMKAASHVLE